MIVMEYTPLGDLLGFMRRSRGVQDRHAQGEGLQVRPGKIRESLSFSILILVY